MDGIAEVLHVTFTIAPLELVTLVSAPTTGATQPLKLK
jgi:hypothetical protein